MAANLTPATIGDLDRLGKLVADFHTEHGLQTSADHQMNALRPLLEGTPLGQAYLIGPSNAPVGYVIVTYGYSVEFGGPDAFIDEIYLRPSVRNRGIGSEALFEIAKNLAHYGVAALHLEVATDDTRTQGFYKRLGFAPRDGYRLMSRRLT